MYWRDKESDTRGRETLSIRLGTLWRDLITAAQLDHHRALTYFQPEGPDHLARRDMMQSQSQARRVICAAARTLQFMDTTKLRPSKSHSRAFPDGRSSNAVPGRDHYSIWYDRESKRYLFADEPYERAAEAKTAERAAWSARHGFEIAKPSWPGMYNHRRWLAALPHRRCGEGCSVDAHRRGSGPSAGTDRRSCLGWRISAVHADFY